jgi:hypothetical protein
MDFAKADVWRLCSEGPDTALDVDRRTAEIAVLP